MDPTLLRRLQLTPDRVVSEARDTFVVARCRDRAGAPVVLKCAPSTSVEALRRLSNEALLLKHLRVRPPLRLLRYREHGDGYLVTEYDPGMLLTPQRVSAADVHLAVADALVEFQSLRVDPARWGIVDIDRLTTGYYRVLVKHLLHAWPAHIGARDAARCLAIVRQALGAIRRHRVICHGDFLPTNLLYHPEDRTVTFTDLERFAGANHPLFDALALCTVADEELDAWDWQRAFLARYLARATVLRLDPRSREFADAYRGILVFFLVYRLSETRIELLKTSYFDGGGKRRYLRRKLGALAAGDTSAWREDRLTAALARRKRNLRLALSRPHFDEHLRRMRSAVSA